MIEKYLIPCEQDKTKNKIDDIAWMESRNAVRKNDPNSFAILDIEKYKQCQNELNEYRIKKGRQEYAERQRIKQYACV